MKTIAVLLSFVFLIAGSINSVNAACAPFAFPNGSKVSFTDASHFVGWFPAMAQSSGGSYDWGMSLCDATIQATGSPACAKGNNMVQTSTCSVAVAGNPTITAMADGTGVILSFAASKQADNNIWTNVVTCVCDPTKNNLNSPSNAYTVNIANLPNIGGAWTMKSNGCCIDGSAPPPGPGGDNSDSGSGGLTWGGVFLIIFFVPLGLYVIGFVAWNYKQGKTGKDLAPHPEFWGALPSLAKDGIMFIVSKIRGTPFVPSESGSSSSSSAGATGAGGDAGVYASV